MCLKEKHAKRVRYKTISTEVKLHPEWRAFLIWHK